MLVRGTLLFLVLQALYSCSLLPTHQSPGRAIAPEMVRDGLAAFYSATDSSNTKCYPLLDRLYFRAHDGITWDGDSMFVGFNEVPLIDLETGEFNTQPTVSKRYALPIFFTYDYTRPLSLPSPYSDSLLIDDFNYPSFESEYHRTAVYYSQFFKQNEGYLWIISCDDGPDFPDNDLYIRFDQFGKVEAATWGIDW